MTELASKQEKEEFNDIMKDDASARAYWKYHTFKLCELNDLSAQLIQDIDLMCDNKQMICPIAVKRMIMKYRNDKKLIRKSVYFGKKAIN